MVSSGEHDSRRHSPPRRPTWQPEHRRTDVVTVGRFAWERALRGRHGLRGQGLAVALALATYASRDGSDIFPGEARLAHDVGVSVRTVRRHLTHLVAVGLLLRFSHGGGRRSRRGPGRGRPFAEYRLSLPSELADDLNAPSSRTQAQVASAGSGVVAARGPLTDAPSQRARLGAELEAILGVTLSSTHLERIRVGALALASAEVRAPDAWVTAVVRRNPTRWRPTPDVIEPDCPDHPGNRMTRCPACRAAAADRQASWRDGPVYAAWSAHRLRPP